jgi:hypothetical protein
MDLSGAPPFPDQRRKPHSSTPPIQFSTACGKPRAWLFGCARAQRNNALTPVERYASLLEKLARLADACTTAIATVEERIAPIYEELGVSPLRGTPPMTNCQSDPANGDGSPRCPICDRSTFSVNWGGKACRLGNTLPFRLIERLARRPNQFFPYAQLLEEIWEGPRSREAVRSVVKVLRCKLREAKMADLAAAIDGSSSHHYGLILDRRP